MEAEHAPALKIREPGIREVRIALEPDMEFGKMVEVLKEALTFNFPRGCAPCLSGLDRLAIDSVIFERLQQRF
ncbi:hypothetical protein GCM10009715_10510 [Paeniglutamicibacter psychrophenolicus]|uniref:Uncharacterized protein n=1 Tax=Paeniglutamicibacter psychrophenolicus TaxID=257454 RepID=A0ABS4WG34_9MICC|nr:hypothetical protein [Paeniglutamicibacter psychrophenolicus]MBP2375152.1 hypothetical protein [Paeniglutamicibacter psychrophenolicus]MDQ0094568.1 hypothetical protein [Paeniglutamicibacter psychrophenolicus]